MVNVRSRDPPGGVNKPAEIVPLRSKDKAAGPGVGIVEQGGGAEEQPGTRGRGSDPLLDTS